MTAAGVDGNRSSIAILGGSGQLGAGLAARWARGGRRVVLGSRSAAKAAECASALSSTLPEARVSGASNVEAASIADIVVIAVPWSSHDDVLREVAGAVAGKIVVTAVVPLIPPKVSTVQLPAEGSAALAAARLLGGQARVVAAFHNVSAAKLQAEHPVDCDVLIFGDDADAKRTVAALSDEMGLRGVDAGPLANAVAAEAMTAVLIGINRRCKVTGAGLRITGIEAPPAA